MNYEQLKRDAESWNNPDWPRYAPDGGNDHLAAFGVEMMPFADDSPITEEALRAEGFTVGDDAYSPVGGGTWLERYNGQWFWHQTLIATLGQLRHLLAAMKGGE